MSTILQLSDLHLGAPETIPGVNPNDVLASYLAEVIERRISIDACIITGDLAHGGQETAYIRLRGLLNSCPWPTRVVPGNHDDQSVGISILGGSYWPNESVWSWSLDDGCTIVGIDSTRSGFHHGELTNDQLMSLDALAARASSCGPWVLAMHHPPVDVGHWWMDGESLLRGRAELLDIVDAHRASAILCGHIHMHTTAFRSGRTPIVAGPSIVHEVVYDDGRERPLRFRKRSPSALLHTLNADNLTTIQITGGGASYLVEGKAWGDEVERTNLRLPAKKD